MSLKNKPFENRYENDTQNVHSRKHNTLEITQIQTTNFNSRTVDICQYMEEKTGKRCKSPATVFITTIFGKSKYCSTHFQLILFRGKK